MSKPILIGELKYQEGANGIFALSYAEVTNEQPACLINAGKLTVFAGHPVNNTYLIETSQECRENPDCLTAVKNPINLLPILAQFVGRVITNTSNVIINAAEDRYIMGNFTIDPNS